MNLDKIYKVFCLVAILFMLGEKNDVLDFLQEMERTSTNQNINQILYWKFNIHIW